MAGPGGKAIRYSLRRSFMRWSILPGTFSFARFDRSAEMRMAGERSATILAFVQGYSRFHQFPDECGGKWFVPLDVEKLLSSFLNFSITAAVGNKLQWSEKAANHTNIRLCLKAGIR